MQVSVHHRNISPSEYSWKEHWETKQVANHSYSIAIILAISLCIIVFFTYLLKLILFPQPYEERNY